MEAQNDASYRTWNVAGWLSSCAPTTAVAPAVPAAIDSSYRQFNAAAMLLQEDGRADAASPSSEASVGFCDVPQQAAELSDGAPPATAVPRETEKAAADEAAAGDPASVFVPQQCAATTP